MGPRAGGQRSCGSTASSRRARRLTTTTCDRAWAEVTAPTSRGSSPRDRLRGPRWPTARFTAVADTSELAGRTASVASDGWLKRAYAIAKAYFLLTKPRVIEL